MELYLTYNVLSPSMGPVRLVLYFYPMKEADPASKALFSTEKRR